MISPNDVHTAALAKEDENHRFRRFFKGARRRENTGSAVS